MHPSNNLATQQSQMKQIALNQLQINNIGGASGGSQMGSKRVNASHARKRIPSDIQML